MGLGEMSIIDADEVARLMPYDRLAAWFRERHRDPMASCERIVYGPPHSDDRFMALPAWQPGGSIGVKLVTVFPDNPSRGRPAIQAVVLLFDGETGTPVAMIDGTELTYRKTAADSALGSQLLSRSDADVLLMIGAGGLAPHLIAAHRAVRPSITKVLAWNRTPAKAEALVDAGLAHEVVADLDAAVPSADIISLATMANEPLLRGALVSPGTHVDGVGAYLPDHRETDDDLIRRAEIFVDSRDAAVYEHGDLVIPLAAGTIGTDAIRADLFDLCRGEHGGRSGPDVVTLFENGGGGHLDLMTAQAIWEAREHR